MTIFWNRSGTQISTIFWRNNRVPSRRTESRTKSAKEFWLSRHQPWQRTASGFVAPRAAVRQGCVSGIRSALRTALRTVLRTALRTAPSCGRRKETTIQPNAMDPGRSFILFLLAPLLSAVAPSSSFVSPGGHRFTRTIPSSSLVLAFHASPSPSQPTPTTPCTSSEFLRPSRRPDAQACAWTPTTNRQRRFGRRRKGCALVHLALSSQNPVCSDDGDRSDDPTGPIVWPPTTLEKEEQSSSVSAAAAEQAIALQQRAEALRAQAQDLQDALQRRRLERETARERAVDTWLERLLVQCTIATNNDNGSDEEDSEKRAPRQQLLNTVDQVAQILQDRRYSPEQVYAIYERLCQTCRITGRDSLERNPLLALLVEASGKVDMLERMDNPNKRWNGIVERNLHKKLFAREWNINLDHLSGDGD